MNFLFTVAINNTIAPEHFKSILRLFHSLAMSLEKLGHNIYILHHSEATSIIDDPTPNMLSVDTINESNYSNIINTIGFKPDYAFIWNGNVPSDKIIIDLFKNDGIKIIYGELGFFNHFKHTCYFDFNGVNCKSSLITAQLPNANLTDKEQEIFDRLFRNNLQTRLHMRPYIFVPLQVETDTQIVSFSPFKKMDDVLQYVADVFADDERDILFKQHPLLKSEVNIRNKFIEVKEDVHHYIPFADMVIGSNSTVLTETMLYHGNIITLGSGLTSRNVTENQRKRYVLEIYSRQMPWSDLADPEKIKKTYFYNKIIGN